MFCYQLMFTATGNPYYVIPRLNLPIINKLIERDKEQDMLSFFFRFIFFALFYLIIYYFLLLHPTMMRRVVSLARDVTIGGSGGRRRRPPPQQDQILSFSHMFLPKSTHVGGWHPPTARRPPNGKSWIRHWLPSWLQWIISILIIILLRKYNPISSLVPFTSLFLLNVKKSQL